MKLDITKLPVDAAVAAFFIAVIGLTFAAAFAATDDGSQGEAVSESPSATASPGPDGTPPPDGGGPIEVTMLDNRFDPEEITVQAGTTATFELTNDGRAIHNMHIAGEGGEFTEDFCDGSGDPCSDPNRVTGGQTATLTWEVPDSPGEVDFRCDFHAEMTGAITIE